MELNPFKFIFNFNKEAGLLEADYSDEKECTYPIEGVLEGFEDSMQTLAFMLQLDKEYPSDHDEVCQPKLLARRISHIVTNGVEVSDVDRLNKHLNIIVSSLGSIYKLGLTPQQAMKALGVVAQANLQKLHAGHDTHGKQLKPDDFIGREVQLQKILDEHP